MSKPSVAVIVPNWNGKKSLGRCLDSLESQSEPVHIIVVENGSTDGSLEFVREHYPKVEVIMHPRNFGFAGGVNSGIKSALQQGFTFIALFNNDAVADKDWVKELHADIKARSKVGIVTSKIMDMEGKHLDSTGDFYTCWGLPFPRGRGEVVSDKYDDQTDIFTGSGGASLYRSRMLEEIGLFDEDFFAYYEDVDLGFRAQLMGWSVRYVPKAHVFHQIGATSSKIPGFTTYQSMKNLPWLLWKNVPGSLVWPILPRFTLVYFGIIVRAFGRGHWWPATRGFARMLFLFPKKLIERWHLQRKRKISVDDVRSLIVWDLPPNTGQLEQLRNWWWKLIGAKGRPS